MERMSTKEKELSLVQGRVPIEIATEVRKILKKKHLTWNDLITACLKYYLDQNEIVDKHHTKE